MSGVLYLTVDGDSNNGDRQALENLASLLLDILDCHQDIRQLHLHERHDDR